jgi:hypothetical protein
LPANTANAEWSGDDEQAILGSGVVARLAAASVVGVGAGVEGAGGRSLRWEGGAGILRRSCSVAVSVSHPQPMKPKRLLGFNALEGKDPRTGEDAEFRIAKVVLESLVKGGPEWKLASLHLVKETVSLPLRAFAGLKRDGMEAAVVLVGKPDRVYHDLRTTLPAWKDGLFAVYCTKDLLVYEWGWIRLQKEYPRLGVAEAEERYCNDTFDRELTL